MTSQLDFLAALIFDWDFLAGIAARLGEPSATTMVLVPIAGVLVGRFLLPGKAPGAD